MIPIAKAIKIIETVTPTLKTETVSLDNAVGRVLAQQIVADTDLPPFDRSQMDGYAVKAADTLNAPVTLPVVGEAAAGKGWNGKLRKGDAVRIMTGAAVPSGADSVQKLELTNETESRVTIHEPTENGRYIIKRGKEIKRGQVLVKVGTTVTTNMIASLAAFGYSKIRVFRQPRVAVLSTGSELVEVNKKPGPDQIRNSNSSMLRALFRDLGIDARVLPISKDNLDSLKTQIDEAAKAADIVVITGGVSVGKYDLTKPALESLGANILFDRVELKPGKPSVFATRKRNLFFGLPGNPVSVAVTFFLFVRHAVMLIQGASEPKLPGGFAVLDNKIKANKERDTYQPVTLATSANGRLIAVPLKWHGSSDFIGFARCDALAIVPKGKSYEAGDVAEILFL